MSDCVQQIKNLVSQGCDFIKKSQKENDASNSSENLSQIYDLFTKVEKESKNIEKEFLEMNKNIKKWRKKLQEWVFVNEKEWKSWNAKDFVRYEYSVKVLGKKVQNRQGFAQKITTNFSLMGL